MFDEIDTVCANNIRVLAADMVQKSNSGHPGAPMGMAAMAHTLWTRVLNYSPNNPKWAGRDRFILSNGHACAMLYTMLHLSGFNLSMDDLKSFRQLHSKCPGHPEAHVTEGVEVSTGPLGQGIANAVGLAIAEENMRATFNREGFSVVDNYTYVFCGDGCLQEGVSAEASSLAGHLGLGKLIVLYDDNQITIDGKTNLSFTEDVLKRYEAYGWHTQAVHAGDHNMSGVESALHVAQRVTGQPSIIAVKTTIGFGSGKQGTAKAHGEPCGKDDIVQLKGKFGFDPSQHFVVKDEVKGRYADVRTRGDAAVLEWKAMFAEYAKQHPELAVEFTRRQRGELPAKWELALPTYKTGGKDAATRNLSGTCLNALKSVLPELIGGSADLTPSNKTALKGVKDFQKDCRDGDYLRFGVREHGMAAVGNGLAAYGGFLPFTATFFTFIEYNFPSVRLAALSQHQHLFVMTHDTIFLGEDGPTHQPIEQAALCRATPNLLLFRPADGNETAGAYIQALKHRNTPSVMVLTRQGLPTLAASSHDKVALGAYVVQDAPSAKPDLIFVATGSEVSLCMEAATLLGKQGVKVRVVSMPCWKLFDQQPAAYRWSVLIPGVATIAVEALSTRGWERYSHAAIGMTSFGESAPYKQVKEHFGFTATKTAARALGFLKAGAAHGKETGLSPFGLLTTHAKAAL